MPLRRFTTSVVLFVLALMALVSWSFAARSSVSASRPTAASARARDVGPALAAAPAAALVEGAAPAAPTGPAPTGAAEANAVDANPSGGAVATVAPGPWPAIWAEPPDHVGNAPPPAVSAMGAVVLDEASCAVLFDKDADLHLAPASLTKIATALVAVQRADLDATTVTSDVDSRTMRGSTVMGLVPGDQFSLRDMLAGLLLPSGNDAALAIGRSVAGSDAAFVAEMNDLVAQLGLHDTHFTNPHGLNGAGHYSSAYDLAVLARDLMSEPALSQIVGSVQWTARGSRTIPLGTLNSLLYSYSGADGVKTGYTRQAGRTMVASATRDGHRLYVVLLNDQQREQDARRLLDWAFASYQWGGAG